MSAHLYSQRALRAAFATLALLGGVQAAQAQAVIGATADIGAGVAANTLGVVAVNEAAGVNNAQANQLTITSGTNAGFNANVSEQSANALSRVVSARASIGAGAFSNATGVVMVNQAAGAGNIQSNSAQMGTAAIGVETVTDGDLSAAAATNGGRGQQAQASGIREASISGSAFRNATGLVQVNQTVGAGNATANSFVLRPPAGTLF